MFFFTGSLLNRTECIYFLVLARASLLGVGRLGGFSSLSFPGMTVMVGICPITSFKWVFLCTPVQQFPFSRTWHRFSGRILFQNLILEGRTVFLICWATHEEGFHLVLWRASSWWGQIQGREEGSS